MEYRYYIYVYIRYLYIWLLTDAQIPWTSLTCRRRSNDIKRCQPVLWWTLFQDWFQSTLPWWNFCPIHAGFPIPSTLLRCSSCQQPRWVCRRPAWRPCRPAVGSSGLPWKVGIEIFFQNVVTGVRWQISALNVVCKGDFASISRNMTVCSEEVHLLSFVGRCV